MKTSFRALDFLTNVRVMRTLYPPPGMLFSWKDYAESRTVRQVTHFVGSKHVNSLLPTYMGFLHVYFHVASQQVTFGIAHVHTHVTWYANCRKLTLLLDFKL